MNISIIGTGYVGLVTGVVFAEFGNRVVCVDIDEQKVADLKAGKPTIYEPGLEEMLKRNLKARRLSFTTNIKDGIRKSEVIFISVNTPPRENGEPDLRFVEDVSKQIALNMSGYKLIVEKSTVPVETGRWIEETVRNNVKKGVKFDVASNPEFLREGSAIQDFLKPDRIVIGVESKKARDILLELYRPLNTSIVVTDIKSAEIIKHASNSFLAMKVSFVNMVSQLCDKVGADIFKVSEGMGLDKRISKDFLNAGVSWGGGCLGKDLSAFRRIAEKQGCNFNLLKEVAKVNEEQKRLFVKKIEDLLWNISDKKICVLGLAFKPNTDDMRSAPSIEIIRRLQEEGAKLKVFDPQSMDKAAGILKGVQFCKDSYAAARGSDCLVILTEWNEFKELDLMRIKKLLKQPVIIDGRNIYDPVKMKKLGFRYVGVGRGGNV